jgi:cbb3-type cytochrome oxidase subunit 3
MAVTAIVFACVLFGGIAWCAFSGRNPRGVRVAALVSLVLILVSVAVSMAFIFGIFTAAGPGGRAALDLPEGEPVKAAAEIWFLVVFALFFLALLVVIIVAFLREQKRVKREKDSLAA